MVRIKIIVSIILIFPNLLYAGRELDDQFNQIAIAATKICGELELSGDKIEVEVEAGITGYLKKLFGFNVKGKVEAERLSQEYFNVLREHLNSELKDIRSCRLVVWKDLYGKLEVPRINSERVWSGSYLSQTKLVKDYELVLTENDGFVEGTYSGTFDKNGDGKSEKTEGYIYGVSNGSVLKGTFHNNSTKGTGNFIWVRIPGGNRFKGWIYPGAKLESFWNGTKIKQLP